MVILGLICAVLSIIGYGLSRKWDRPEVFDWTNVVIFMPLAITQIIAGAFGGAIISIFFGLIGIYALFMKKDATIDDTLM